MGVSEVFERDGRAERTARPEFDLIVSKLRRPPLRPGIVDRPLLLGRLAQGDDRPVVSVVAPPGYGKSTLLSQWAERGRQPFAWVTVEEPDNDPKVLLAYVAAALDEIEPLDGRDGETPLTFTGGDVFMRDYLRSELLDRLPDTYVSFLTRTSALDRMSGPLCDATLGAQGSAGMLAGHATPTLTTSRRSPSCTPPPHGSRSIRATDSGRARNWPGRSVFARA